VANLSFQWNRVEKLLTSISVECLNRNLERHRIAPLAVRNGYAKRYRAPLK
jgi:hypothetical protein